MKGSVSVAIPTKDAGPGIEELLVAVARQSTDRPCEVVVCDSGSTDGTVRRAREHGATIIEIPPTSFGHGRTRNLLMERTRGSVVLFLTQDATPARETWVDALCDAVESAPDVGVACGPYLPRPTTSPMVARELEEFFDRLADDGGPSVTRAPGGDVGGLSLDQTFHTDANGALLRDAWRAVPFRDIPYAEDRALCLDLLAAGWARVFVPGAPVLHAHEFPAGERFQRLFDEFRALHDVHGTVTSIAPRALLGAAVHGARHDRAWVATGHGERPWSAALATRSFVYHLERGLAAAAGTRSRRIPAFAQRRLSRDGRSERAG